MASKKHVDVGDEAPDFTLQSSSGGEVTMSHLLRDSHVALYFFREFSWTYCLNHFAQLGRMYDEIRNGNANVLVIGGGKIEEATRLANLFKSPFPILVDRDRRTYSDYGFGKVIGLVQRSGTVLIDRTRTVRHVHRAANPQSSLRKDEFLTALQTLGA